MKTGEVIGFIIVSSPLPNHTTLHFWAVFVATQENAMYIITGNASDSAVQLAQSLSSL